jgi:hypothetical protein
MPLIEILLPRALAAGSVKARVLKIPQDKFDCILPAQLPKMRVIGLI